ncbi:2-amino-4-hydroxy-6-hydroxymethyldihydropteridine diphosphokinase [Flavobacterium sp. I3-2]|uniref:2-amino-4-hydroxy-6- hydroxymethyldihydropteridine diphosphokinase n=1 Tax=Flavobacterium sp. I3-2 TaxID=2748319 RepID=UPI0015B03883|nr:2-amino-4-hydroxy-6-hydroxymethyldihydropteridine diphosphokinase [Flavobacterium sp. I3-2]
MYKQHQIILSLGSNQGNRKNNLQQAIDLINHEVGSVISISPIYETPSWGFESDAFYNCAILIHSFKSAEDILNRCLQIEKRLGRIRNQTSGYAARSIDIDLVSYNEEIISTENLNIPHPFVQDRKFVLKPCCDIKSDWVHPKLKKTFKDLLTETSDISEIKKVDTLTNPLDKYTFNQLNFIAIEGNIGSGKTTLTQKIAADFNAKTVLERFADNPFLPQFYKHPTRYAFPLEMSFLADRYSQISEDLGQLDLFKDFIVADYYIYKSLIFAQVTIDEDEFRLYKNIFDIMYKEVTQPDLYIYLHQETNRLLDNIKKRGRSYESEIPADYLNKINKSYADFIKINKNQNTLVIDMTEIDLIENQEDYIAILNQIQDKIKTN